ncbi:hypothetical protein [Candidatus Macondimonas diazotrophica]|jgi:hypothetical protein|uniref:Uncharacterized protein n=1 Tax=Candidatus Macondimonas diazotrophica TaxID=2305248 RepID=A0A4Z0F6I6_9GAMM|nr:hypothetical protein [Candidatus Macondimonas diazotrophica]TFZ81280.1 hypothetical protein E4680_13160 [Candidatus Macondimonas diazotrophica]
MADAPYRESFWKLEDGRMKLVEREDQADIYEIHVADCRVRIERNSDGHFSPSPWELRAAMSRMFDRGRRHQAHVISDAISYKAGRR